ncbi:MAG: hypothetical protein ICV62_15070, partial [Cyanobacteria bacterium Co-bin13]|nr:hypothetical protein [Cyanobacteria bacterium Co-bin13]
MGKRAWLENALTETWIPRIKALQDTAAGRAAAQAINQELRDWWASRGLTTLRQQQSLMDITRRYLKTYLGPDHFSLDCINFSTAEWIALNTEKQRTVAGRNESVQFIDKPDSIVAKAVRLLEMPDWADICAGLAVLTGRRSSELLSTAQFEKKSQWSVIFTGALKRRGELQQLSFEIPTLTTADRVIQALARVRHELPGAAELSAAEVSRRYARAVEVACDRNFTTLVPPRAGKDSLYTHLFRAIYATIATFWYCPPNVNETEFKAAIQGHYAILDEKNPELQRLLGANRHYSDYEIADAVIAQHGGKRKGIKLGHGGIKPLEVFIESYQRAQAKQHQRPLMQQPLIYQPQAVNVKMSRIRITEPDRAHLESIFEVLGFEGTQHEQMGQLVQWVHNQLRGLSQPTPEPALDQAEPAPSDLLESPP